MALFDGAFESAGQALVDAGESCMGAGIDMWKSCAEVVMRYCTQDPTALGAAWSSTRHIYDLFMGIGASLLVLYFVIGWLRESIDIRNNFTLENMFRFFLRLALTSAVLINAFNLIKSVMRLSSALAAEVGMNIATSYSADNLFASLTEDVTGAGMLGIGFLCLIGGFIGMMVIIVSGISIVLSVLTRFFKIFLCIPFAPPALASFAGGHGLSQSGIAWTKTFLAYCLEIVVIALALMLAFSFFRGKNEIFASVEGWSGTVLGICNICLPMLTAVTCVKGAENIIRKTLGL